MKIEKILAQNRRDFTAIYKCDACEYAYEGRGYDDANFHSNVIPNMMCPNCGERSGDDYRPLTTKYPEGFQV